MYLHMYLFAGDIVSGIRRLELAFLSCCVHIWAEQTKIEWCGFCHGLSCLKDQKNPPKNIRLHPAFPKASWVSSAGKYWNGTRKYTKLAGYSATRFWNHDHMTIISNKMQQIHANSLKQTGLDLWCYLQWNLPEEGWLRRHQHGTCFTQRFSGGSAIHIAPIVAPSKRKLRTQIKLLR